MTMNRRRALRRAYFAAAMGGVSALALPWPGGMTPAMAQSTAISVAAGPLEQALLSLGRQTGLRLSYASNLTAGRTSGGARNAADAGEALSQVLRGTGLQYAFVDAVTVRISAADSALGALGEGSVLLDTVTLTGARGVTEGTGSYATGEASTATGLALSIRQTPQSVSVTTDQRIKDQGFSSTREALNYTTGVSSVSYETDRDSTYSRGFWVGNYIVDGVSLPTYQGWYSGVSMSSSAAIYDRVEVLRGATGLLTGTGEPGAAVSITRKRANATKPEGSVELRYGSWDRIGGTVDFGTPLTEDGRVRARFIADVASEESFVDRYSVDRKTYYGALDVDLTPSTKLSFSLEFRDHDPRGTMWGELPAIFTNGQPTNFPRGFSNAPDWAYWASSQVSAVAKIEHEFDNQWKAEATFGATRRKYEAELLYMWGDVDAVTGLGLNASAWGGVERTKLYSFDAKASGPVELFGRTHTLNFGIRADQDWIKRSWPGYSGTIDPIGNIFEWDGVYARPNWNPTTNPDWDSNVSKQSAYASGQFSLADPLNLVLGGRYTSWKSKFQTDDREFSEITPFAGLVYDLNDQWSVYASYTEVFDPQSYRDRNGGYLDPIVGESFEVGTKAELFDGGLNVTLAYFDTLQDNVATRDGDALVPGTTDYAYIGAKGISSKGVELELAGEIQPGWNLFFGASALRMRDADGERYSTDTPTRTLKMFTSYDLTGDWDGLTLGGGLRWQNKAWTDISTGGNSYRFTQDGFAVVDVMARYEINDKWSAQLNVNNLFDKTYYNGVGSQVSYAPPRNAMVSLVSKF